MEVQQISNLSKEDLINIFNDNGFTYDSNLDKFTKQETINAGKLIVNGKEIYKTQEVNIEMQYIYAGSIEDHKNSVLAHQIKLVLNESEVEFLITDKYDLNYFFGLSVGEVPAARRININRNYLEDINEFK